MNNDAHDDFAVVVVLGTSQFVPSFLSSIYSLLALLLG